ncbi:hypothetical protein GCM10009603_08150 [Nocardiopsis exhalans]
MDGLDPFRIGDTTADLVGLIEDFAKLVPPWQMVGHRREIVGGLQDLFVDGSVVGDGVDR